MRVLWWSGSILPRGQPGITVRQRHAIADAVLGEQIPGCFKLGLDLAPDALDDCPDVMHFIAILSTPDRLQHLPVQQALSSISCKIRKHIELPLCERHIESVQ